METTQENKLGPLDLDLLLQPVEDEGPLATAHREFLHAVEAELKLVKINQIGEAGGQAVVIQPLPEHRERTEEIIRLGPAGFAKSQRATIVGKQPLKSIFGEGESIDPASPSGYNELVCRQILRLSFQIVAKRLKSIGYTKTDNAKLQDMLDAAADLKLLASHVTQPLFRPGHFQNRQARPGVFSDGFWNQVRERMVGNHQLSNEGFSQQEQSIRNYIGQVVIMPEVRIKQPKDLSEYNSPLIHFCYRFIDPEFEVPDNENLADLVDQVNNEIHQYGFLAKVGEVVALAQTDEQRRNLIDQAILAYISYIRLRSGEPVAKNAALFDEIIRRYMSQPARFRHPESDQSNEVDAPKLNNKDREAEPAIKTQPAYIALVQFISKRQFAVDNKPVVHKAADDFDKLRHQPWVTAIEADDTTIKQFGDLVSIVIHEAALGITPRPLKRMDSR